MENGSLLRRILPPLAGAVALLTLVVMFVGVAFMREAVLERARLRATTLSSLEADRLESLMNAGPHNDLQGLVEKLQRNPDIAAVRILQPDGTVYASSIPSEIGWPAGAHTVQQRPDGDTMPPLVGQSSSTAASAVHTVRPLPNRGECQACHDPRSRVVGHLDLDVAVNPHVVGLTTFTGLSALLGLLYLVAVVGVAGPLVAVVVGRPVRRLMGAMQRIQAGDLDLQVESSGTREIDALFEGFNRMVEQLRRGRAAEEEARRLELERVQQLASVGELAAGLAHEIRNPLAGVKAVVDVVARDTQDDARKAVLRDAGGELARIDQIVRELLQYARPKTPVPSVFDLTPLVHDALALTFPAAASGAGSGARRPVDGGSTRARSELAEDLPPVRGDVTQVRQVLVNLLLNADQAAGPDGHVTVSTGRRGDLVWCRVRDSGAGVPLERAEAIFRPFVTSKPRGTGLGLSISRRMIELQGGTLTLDNPGEPQAAFTFTLPVAAS